PADRGVGRRGARGRRRGGTARHRRRLADYDPGSPDPVQPGVGGRVSPERRGDRVGGARTDRHYRRERLMRVSVLGLGHMGAAIARRLQRADAVELTVWNRSSGPAEEFAAAGVFAAGLPSEAAAGADVCITMLSDGPAVQAVLLGEGGALTALP